MEKQTNKILIMSQAQLQEFESRCLDQLSHREAKVIISYLARFVQEAPAQKEPFKDAQSDSADESSR
jgi:hypothetical protein